MPANNFWSCNTSKLYAFIGRNEYEYEDILNYLAEILKESGYTILDGKENWINNYQQKFAKKEIWSKKDYFGVKIFVNVYDGYYEGMQFDYDFWYMDWLGREENTISQYDLEELAKKELGFPYDFRNGYQEPENEMEALKLKLMVNKLEKELKELEKIKNKEFDNLEKIFKKLSNLPDGVYYESRSPIKI